MNSRWRDRAQRFFRDVRVEMGLVLLILLSVGFAAASLFWDYPWLEMTNYLFSLLFCLELSLRFLVRSNTRRYWQTFWLDWVASFPWDLLMLLLLPVGAPSAALARLLRLPRLFRLLRIVSLGRSRVLTRIRYHIKKQLEQSLVRQLLILALLSLGFTAVFGLGFAFLGSRDFSESFYFSFITLMSSDSIFEVADKSPLFKGLTVFLAFIGIIIFNGIFIAVVVARMTDYLDRVREGLGEVPEKGHFLILGWNNYMPYFLDALETYGRTEERRLSVVFLVNRVDQAMRSSLGHFRWADVSFRKGLPYRREDLEMLSLADARSVLVPGSDALDYYDREAVQAKSFLTLDSLAARTHRFRPNLLFTLSEEVMSRYLGEFRSAAADTADLFFYSAKILVSILVQPGLHRVLSELFSFEGSEFHFLPVPAPWAGASCQAVQHSLERLGTGVILTGIQERASHTLEMLPPPERQLKKNQELILLARTDLEAQRAVKKVHPSREVPGPSLSQEAAEPTQPAAPLETTVQTFQAAIIGVNPKLPFIVEELSKLNCGILVIDNQSAESFQLWYEQETGHIPPEGIEYVCCDFRSQHEVERVLPLDRLNRVLVLADKSASANQAGEIDADTLFKILRIRTLKNEAYPNSTFSLLAEILSPDSQEAVELIPQVSFVMGPLILGRLLAMLAVEPSCGGIFRELVQRGGTDIRLIPFRGPAGTPFAEAARGIYGSGSLAIGYIRENAVEINPPRNAKLKPTDQLILFWRE